MSTIGERLKASRESKGLLQSELAKLIGVKSANVISNWEKDVSKPDANKMVRICQVLEISLSYLLDYYGKEKAPPYSGEAMNLAKDYDSKLDSWGKKQVRDVADNEIARCEAERRAASALQSQQGEPGSHSVERLVYVNPAAAGMPLYAESDFERHCAQELPAAGEDIPVPATMDTGGQERAQSDVAARVEELERQNKELAAKVAAMEEEDAKMEAAAELSLGKPFSGGTKTG